MADRQTEQVAGDEFAAALQAFGFHPSAQNRRGETIWTWPLNRFMTLAVHDRLDDHVVVTWALELGEYLEQRGWRLSVTDTSTAELYPQRDVMVPRDIEAVGAEIRRVRAALTLELGAADL